MLNFNKIIISTVIVFACLSQSACITRYNLHKESYLLTIPTPKNLKIEKKQELIIDQVTDTAPFDKMHFIYRTQNQYLTDYYNYFLTPPSQQIFPALLKYIKYRTAFNPSISPETDLPQLELQGRIIEIYADYRQTDKPQAMVAMRFVLIKTENNRRTKVFEKTFRASNILTAKNSSALVAAWNKCFRQIMLNLTNAIK